MLYEGYTDDEGLTMIPVDDLVLGRKDVLGSNARLVWLFATDTEGVAGWAEAMTAWHRRNGWEEYRLCEAWFAYTGLTWPLRP